MDKKDRKQCHFCTTNTRAMDWKQSDFLYKFLTPQGKITSRKRLGTCAKHQRMLQQAVKRARFMALLPYETR